MGRRNENLRGINDIHHIIEYENLLPVLFELLPLSC